ncbi:protein BCL9 homolog [Phymastichus coffea]|uniref:protein BCL9 homolog n=1 Tax=Phymastichus coffea TaxID=108790 RepID=UPI00273CDA83|nr:protein BCL9 homolog [Phymastichus coffea]
MKTEKKSSEPSCVPPASVKEDADNAEARIKIKEDTPATGNDNLNDEPINDDPAEAALKDAGLEVAVSTADPTIPPDNQNGQSGNQALLNSGKQEQDSIGGNVEEMPSECGANVVMPIDGMPPMIGSAMVKQIAAANAGEAQYMQQQSQIFVFTTQMANKGAEAVLQGHYPTIIAYHMAQPSTKKFLEKFPSKTSHFRQNPPQWMNNIGAMKQKGLQHSPNMGFPSEQPPDIPPLDPNDPFWNEQPNMRNLNGSNPLGNPDSSLDDTNINVPCLVPTSPNNAANPQAIGGPAIGHSPNMMGNPTSPGSGGVQPSLQGVKIPDENLTPQQQQHRNEQLATIAKMRQMLFREQTDPTAVGPMDPTQIGAQGQLGPSGSLPPVNAPNQCGPMDWHKMQHSLFDGKNKVGVNSPGVPVRGPGGQLPGGPGALPPGSGSNGPPPRSQGPPPPYHQTTRSASVPIAIQSPNPSSPNNPTSNLSLPSPRASSALNSPADCNRQFQLGTNQRGQLPGQSPTSQDSPATAAAAAANANRLNHSNPGTPMSQNHLGAMSPSGTPQKDLASLDFPNSQPPNVDAMFCRSLPSMAQQKQQMGPGGQVVKELMPVPSPQQISYLNTFDGQELTIQKQPNTSLKDGSLPANNQGNNNPDMTNRMLPGAMSNSGGGNDNTSNNQYGPRSEGASPSMDSSNRGFGGTLHSPHTPHTPHTPGSVAPHTPVDPAKQHNKTTSAQSSPASHNASLADINMGPPRTPNTKSETSPTSKDQQQQQPPPPSQQQQQQSLNPGIGPGGMMTPMVGPGGNGNPFGCGRPTTSQTNDNIPLNPNNMNNRIGGLGSMSSNSFDPITSLAQMSQQLTNTAANNALGNDNSSMHSGNPAGMMSFNNPHNVHMMQMQQQQQQQQQQVNEMNGGCHMTGGPGGPTSEPGDVTSICMGLGGPATSYSPTPHTGSPGMSGKIGSQQHHPMMQHSGMMGPGPGPQGPSNPNINVSQSGGYPSGPGPGMMGGPDGGPQSRHGMPPQHMHGGPSPYNGANVQVKPNAPNTIQYLPARPNVGHAPRGPPSLEFLQRFASPGMSDPNKINPPSVNLQYFPNGCMPNNMGPQGPTQHGSMGPGMPGNGPPGQPMHPNMRPPGPVGRQPANIRMQHMGGGGMFPGSPMDPDKVFSSDMVPPSALGPPQNTYGPAAPGQKQSNAMSQLGPHPPDATQPLPPSMGGAGGNFKSGPFVGSGPSMSDPNYAQQFHHFQQQLYATNSRGSGPPQGHPGMQPNAHQQFFMPNK